MLPLLTWWLGWFPGFLSSDSVDQLGQVKRFEFFNAHPAVHTFSMWVVTRVWDNAGAISLVQVLAMAGLLALTARRLAQLGVPVWVAVGAAWLVSALPAVATTTIALWKDVPFTLALLWAFTELLLLARDPGRFWNRRWPPLRLGAALGATWLYRHNGFITVGLFLLALVWVSRRDLRRLLPTVATLAIVAYGVQLTLYPLLDVNRTAIEPSTVFISDVAASLTHEPGNFSTEELTYVESIAPVEVWTDRYDCHDSTPLAFAPEFSGHVIADDPRSFRRLVVRTLLRDPDTVLGHRWCAASYLFWPPQPDDAYFHRPPFEIAANDLGIERAPISERAFSATKAIFTWIEPPGRLWLTWRPALVVWVAMVAYASLAARRGLRRLLLPGALMAAQIANVIVTTPAQEFRFAFGIYVMGLLSVPLVWLVAHPAAALLVGGSSPRVERSPEAWLKKDLTVVSMDEDDGHRPHLDDTKSRYDGGASTDDLGGDGDPQRSGVPR